jgi:hypothetical protein
MYVGVFETILETLSSITTSSFVRSGAPFNDLPQAETRALSFYAQRTVHGGCITCMWAKRHPCRPVHEAPTPPCVPPHALKSFM